MCKVLILSSPVWSGQEAIKRQWVCNLATSCAHHARGVKVFNGFVILSSLTGGQVANYFWTKYNDSTAFLLWDNGRHWLSFHTTLLSGSTAALSSSAVLAVTSRMCKVVWMSKEWVSMCCLSPQRHKKHQRRIIWPQKIDKPIKPVFDTALGTAVCIRSAMFPSS